MADQAQTAPFASCCLLSYNRPAFVAEAITSLVEHAGYPLELIVHDDGSDDPEVRRRLRGLLEEGLISTLIENPTGHNQGQGVALNRMFAIAAGDPLIKLDHDLVFEPGWLRRTMAILEGNRGRAAAGEEPRLGALGLFRYDKPPLVHTETLIEIHEGWEEHRDFVGSAIVMPRDAWQRFGPFGERDERFGEDREMKLAIAAAEGWACGLSSEDLVRNQGFGIGPSTIRPAAGEITPIRKRPWIVGEGDRDH